MRTLEYATKKVFATAQDRMSELFQERKQTIGTLEFRNKLLPLRESANTKFCEKARAHEQNLGALEKKTKKNAATWHLLAGV